MPEQPDATPQRITENADARAPDTLDALTRLPPPPPTRPPTVAATRKPNTRLAAAAMLLLSLPMLAIGGWAVGAVLYMMRVRLSPDQNDVTYPLLHWDWQAGPPGTPGDYATSSKIMAWAMLACLPIAAVLMVGALHLRRRRQRNRPPKPAQ